MLAATIVGGIAIGFLYGLLALTLILLVRTTGVLNFAAADTGMLCAFVAFAAMTDLQLSPAPALLVTAVFAVAFGALSYGIIVLVSPAEPLILSLRTLGLLIIVRAGAYRLWGANAPYSFPRIVPDGGIAVLGLNVSYTQLGIIGLALAVAGAVGWMMRATRIGLILRAVSSDREAAADLGVAVARVDVVAWCMATFVAGVVGIMVAHLSSLSPDMMSPILLAGFAAAQLGDMQSMLVALVAGITLGIVQSVSSVYFNEPEWSQILSFAVLAGGLLLRGQLRRRVVTT